MSFRMVLWEVDGKTLKPVSTQPLDFEDRLEDWLASDPSLSGMDVLISG
jgi:hypothetical protein